MKRSHHRILVIDNVNMVMLNNNDNDHDDVLHDEPSMRGHYLIYWLQ